MYALSLMLSCSMYGKRVSKEALLLLWPLLSIILKSDGCRAWRNLCVWNNVSRAYVNLFFFRSEIIGSFQVGASELCRHVDHNPPS